MTESRKCPSKNASLRQRNSVRLEPSRRLEAFFPLYDTGIQTFSTCPPIGPNLRTTRLFDIFRKCKLIVFSQLDPSRARETSLSRSTWIPPSHVKFCARRTNGKTKTKIDASQKKHIGRGRLSPITRRPHYPRRRRTRSAAAAAAANVVTLSSSDNTNI